MFNTLPPWVLDLGSAQGPLDVTDLPWKAPPHHTSFTDARSPGVPDPEMGAALVRCPLWLSHLSGSM